MTWFPAGIVDAGGAAPFTPASIANLQGWFDAQDDTTIIDGTPPDVQSWNDKSSQAHVATQGTELERPHESSVNGNASLLFDGVDDVLRDATAGDIVSPPMTIGIVVTPTSIASGTGDALRLRLGSDSVHRMRKTGTDDFAYTVGSGGGTIDLTLTGAIAVGETRWFIARARNSGDGISDILDDLANANSGNLSASISDVDDLNIGANADSSNAFPGHIHEIVIYNRFLTDAERTQLGNYFAGKWSLTPPPSSGITFGTPTVQILEPGVPGNATLNFTHTSDPAADFVVIGFSCQSDSNATTLATLSATYDGVACDTRAQGREAIDRDNPNTLWVTVAPQAGTAVALSTDVGALQNGIMWAVDVFGADTVTPVGADVEVGTSGNNAFSEDIITDVDGAVVFGAYAMQGNDAGPFTPSTDFTEQLDTVTPLSGTVNGHSLLIETREVATAGTVSINALSTISDGNTHAYFSLNPAP